MTWHGARFRKVYLFNVPWDIGDFVGTLLGAGATHVAVKVVTEDERQAMGDKLSYNNWKVIAEFEADE